MLNNRILDEETIGDIILCEPITRRGKEALERLGLAIEEITPSFFYEKLRVASRYDEKKEFERESDDNVDDFDCLYYQYTVNHIQFGIIKERIKKFDSQFLSNAPNTFPLLMLGVAGNGKTIEINRRIREISSGETEFECGSVYFDLEAAFTEITYGITYQHWCLTPLT